jgi:hypothetical protein
MIGLLFGSVAESVPSRFHFSLLRAARNFDKSGTNAPADRHGETTFSGFHLSSLSQDLQYDGHLFATAQGGPSLPYGIVCQSSPIILENGCWLCRQKMRMAIWTNKLMR